MLQEPLTSVWQAKKTISNASSTYPLQRFMEQQRISQCLKTTLLNQLLCMVRVNLPESSIHQHITGHTDFRVWSSAHLIHMVREPILKAYTGKLFLNLSLEFSVI